MNGFARFTTPILVSLLMLAGCASVPNTHPDPQDPFERLNRKIFAFNQVVDGLVFRPVAKVYDTVLPDPAKKGIGNFFDNVGEIPTVANDVLQLKLVQALADSWRFVINSTIGVGGLVDVASRMGLKKNYQDLGLTLARWGVKKTPYIVIPILGSSTFRDLIAYPVNYAFLTPYPYLKNDTLRYSLLSTRFVNYRAQLLPADELIEQAFDPYAFVRDAYLQQRAHTTGEETNGKEHELEQEGIEAADEDIEGANEDVVVDKQDIASGDGKDAQQTQDNAKTKDKTS